MDVTYYKISEKTPKEKDDAKCKIRIIFLIVFPIIEKL